jgi:two-component system, NarL family, sensor histidine kinase UhpB
MRKPKLLLVVIAFFSHATLIAQKINIDSLVNVVNGSKEDTGKVIAYRMLAGILSNTNPEKGIEYGWSGALLGKKIGFDKGVAGCYLNICASYNSAGKIDSALIYIDTAIYWSLKVGEPGRISLVYLNRADYKRQMGDMKGSLIDCDTSLVYAEKANRDDVKGRIYQTIGSVYHAQDNWEQSKLYSEKAYQLYEKMGNKKMMGIVMNNLGNVYKHTKQYEQSIISFKNAIKLGVEADDQVSLAMYYSNMSDAYLEKGDLTEAEASGLKSLAYAREHENEMEIAQSQLVLTGVYNKMKKIPAAIQSGLEAYQVFKKNELTEETLTISDLLAEIYYKTGNYKEAYNYTQISRSLSDSVSRKKFDDEVASMQTKFKVNEKDKEIQLLGKDRELQQQKLNQQRVYIVAAIAIALLALIGIVLAINRYRLRQRMKELELRNQIAADLHDEVGSSLSSIHMLSQMVTTQSDTNTTQQNILNKVSSNAKETMDRMSDIVWMIKPGDTETGSLKQRMERFATEICDSKNIRLSIDLSAIENIKLSMAQRKNVYLIFKEALNNSVKYSGSEKIDIKASLQNKRLELRIKDFGKGFEVSSNGRGNGLGNMKNRAGESGGTLAIDSIVNEGTTVTLTLQV